MITKQNNVCPFFQPLAVPQKTALGVELSIQFVSCLGDKCKAYDVSKSTCKLIDSKQTLPVVENKSK